jgi:predicted HicB family RNase H-like nuclease
MNKKQKKKEGEMKGKEQTKPRRTSRGARYDDRLWARAEKVATKQKTSVRSVIEQALERGLPELERMFGVEPPPGQPPTDQL